MGLNFHNTHSSTYERMSGGCTLLVAQNMLTTLSMLPPAQHLSSASNILDNASGPGIVTALIKSLQPIATITATDLSPAMLERVRERAEAESWSGVSTQVADLRDLSVLEDGVFSHAFTNFGIHAMGQADKGGPARAVGELYRVLKKGGVCVVSTWAERGWPDAYYNAAKILRPHEEPNKAMSGGTGWETGSGLFGLLENAGFGMNVKVEPVQSYTSAASLDELTDNMMLAAPMFLKGMKEEEVVKMRALLMKEFRNLKAFEEGDFGARIGMTAWVGVAWK